MYAVGRLGSYISRGVYTVSGPFHPFGGAVDIIVVEQQDGSFKSSPWYVRFGKFQGVLKTREKVVSISVDGVEADFHMYLDHKGETYFQREVDDGEEEGSVLYPLSSGDDTDGQSQTERRPMKSKSCNFDAIKSSLDDQIGMGNEKAMTRTKSGRSRLMGLFGRRSMKEETFREGEGDASVVRVSLLERAEIAADLLELQWSTNLPTKKPKKGNASRFSASDELDGKADKDLHINEEQDQVSSSLHDNIRNSSGQDALHEETGSQNEQIGSSSRSSSENLKCSVDEASVGTSCLSTEEKVVETPTLGESVLDEQCEVISIISRVTSVGNAYHDGNANGVILELTGPNSQLPYSNAPGACSSQQFHAEQVSNGRDCALQGCVISQVDSRKNGVQSSVHCEMSDGSIVGLDDSSKQTYGTMYFANGGSGEIYVHAETLHATTELPSEEEIQDTGKKQHAGHIGLETELVELTENHVPQTNSSCSCTHDYNEVDLEKSVIVTESYTQIVRIDPILGSIEEVKSLSICTTSSSSNSDQQVEGEKIFGDESIKSSPQSTLTYIGDSQNFYGGSISTNVTSIAPSQSSEEEQLLFGDLDEYKVGAGQTIEPISPDNVKKENHSSFSPEGIKEVHESVDTTSYESYSSSNKFVEENPSPSVDSENSVVKSRVVSSPISIPRNRKAVGEGVGRLVESVPNMWFRIDNLDANARGCRSLSHSLDANPKSLKWTLLSKDDTNCIKSGTEREQELAKEQLDIEDTQISGDLNSAPASPAVEISLCKHLLFEGMGADAASKAFDAEKLDINKFTSIGPSIVKDDRLVVKIGQRYFPWNSAAPLVLGMLSFGGEQILEPEGMIAVDRVEKPLEGDPSKPTVASSGSWRLWPFTFRRSRSRKGMQPASDNARIPQAENATESTVGTDETINEIRPRRVKKMFRANTPTSEQLASLNLKEGRNTITFTFSTGMLGKQQVDARIYLWKWNTRIVISDVDGTITKSDVLGQFMPMVGVDWSQTGVAHLFSAIKENGYQLLFLSARAIAQAYHTRQFLLNLKQDGKALPDGPIVISPDGLFPSLFREVIRRAPHEFKIACLEDIRALFPSDCNPFYAGFGNRDTDEISYLKVGIPKGKIFIINPKGEVAVNRRVSTKSYTSLHDLVHGMFPPMTSSEQEDFNSWNFWKLPPPSIDM